MMSAPIDMSSLNMDYKDGKYNQMANVGDCFTTIVYVDSTECSPCLISSFYRWNDIIDLFSKRNNVDFRFIVSPKLRDLKKTKRSTKYTLLKVPIIIDSMHVFMRDNPHIPSGQKYHTFLVDSENNIILVGNPLDDEKIRSLYIKTLLQ